MIPRVPLPPSQDLGVEANFGVFPFPPSSFTYVQSDGPRYMTGHSINLGGQIGVLVLSIFGILYCLRENRLRARGKRDHRLEGLTEDEKRELGYRHPEFRYMS